MKHRIGDWMLELDSLVVWKIELLESSASFYTRLQGPATIYHVIIYINYISIITGEGLLVVRPFPGRRVSRDTWHGRTCHASHSLWRAGQEMVPIPNTPPAAAALPGQHCIAWCLLFFSALDMHVQIMQDLESGIISLMNIDTAQCRSGLCATVKYFFIDINTTK